MASLMKGLRSTALLVFCMAGSLTTMASESEKALKAVARSNTAFTSSLYSVLSEAVDGNLIFSPYSLSAVMAMVKAGAKGQTSKDIQTALKFPDDDAVLFRGYKELLSSLKSDGENFTLETVNRVYSNKGFELNSQFTGIVKDNFGAEIEQLDFSRGAEAAKTINDFVSLTTHEKIKDLINAGDLDSLTRLVLVNAIYFKGLWKHQFDKKNTKEADFHLNEKDTVKVQMMRLEADFPFADIEELDAKAIALPYKGDRLSMIILLPNEIDGLKKMEEKLKTFSLATIPARLRDRKINLNMPKFKLESTIDLKGPLTALGAGSIFDQTAADFSGIPADPTKEQLYVSKAVQKAFIEVNEEGSEAAAATGLQIMLKSAFIGPRFNANRPFLAMIVDEDKNLDATTVLFLTKFSNPTQTTTEVKRISWAQSSATLPSSTKAALILPSILILQLFTLMLRFY